ncbi:MAG: PorT family protein [Chlorobi bacterium]|nr:PorT family protein [Chlorobiota bacterium]
MKKIFFYSAFFILIFFSNASGQFVRYGISGGINKTGLFGADKPDSYNKKTGYFGGLYLDNRIGEHLSAQSEINFSLFNFEFSEPVPLLDNSLLTVNEKDYYLSVPVFLKFKQGYEFIFWHIGLGGQISLLLKTDRYLSLTVNNHDTDPVYYYDFENNNYEYGFIGNAGFQFKALDVFVRYYISMRNIYKNGQARDMSFNTLNFGLSWQFNYKSESPYGRKTGWTGLKYKIKHLFK